MHHAIRILYCIWNVECGRNRGNIGYFYISKAAQLKWQRERKIGWMHERWQAFSSWVTVKRAPCKTKLCHGSQKQARDSHTCSLKAFWNRFSSSEWHANLICLASRLTCGQGDSGECFETGLMCDAPLCVMSCMRNTMLLMDCLCKTLSFVKEINNSPRYIWNG